MNEPNEVVIDRTRRITRALGTLITNVDPDQIPDSAVDWITQKPAEAGAQFTAFLRNGCRLMIGEPKIVRLNPSIRFDPAEFIGQGWTTWKGPANGNGLEGLEGEEEVDKRSLALTEIDLSTALFENCLKKGENMIKGEEKLKRLRQSGNIQLAGNVVLALWKDYKENGENSYLEWLRRNRGITYLDFFGLVLRGPSGDRSVLCLYWGGGRWRWRCSWLESGWNAGGLSAGLASSPRTLAPKP